MYLFFRIFILKKCKKAIATIFTAIFLFIMNIILFNFLYNEHKNFNKLSKEKYDSFNKGMSYIYYIFVSEEKIKTIFRSAIIALTKEILINNFLVKKY